MYILQPYNIQVDAFIQSSYYFISVSVLTGHLEINNKNRVEPLKKIEKWKIRRRITKAPLNFGHFSSRKIHNSKTIASKQTKLYISWLNQFEANKKSFNTGVR